MSKRETHLDIASPVHEGALHVSIVHLTGFSLNRDVHPLWHIGNAHAVLASRTENTITFFLKNIFEDMFYLIVQPIVRSLSPIRKDSLVSLEATFRRKKHLQIYFNENHFLERFCMLKQILPVSFKQ